MHRFISWNVLYREYEIQYAPESKILKQFPNETDRISAIIDTIKENSDKYTVICLQEVSKQLLNSLSVSFSETHDVFSFNERKQEYLVIITPKTSKFKFVTSFSHCTANGYLVVSNGDYFVVNCHLIPQRHIKANAMDYLLNSCVKHKNIIVAGDFNEEYKNVSSCLESKFVCPRYGKTYKKRNIDHMIFTKDFVDYNKYETSKVNRKNMSDHHMIRLDLFKEVTSH